MTKRHAAALVAGMIAGLALTAAGAVQAETTKAETADKMPPALEVVDCRQHDMAQEKADALLATKTSQVMQAHDMAQLDALLPDLKAAVARAPDVPSRPELCGDKILVYSDDISDVLVLTAIVGSDKARGAKTIEQRYSLPYASLAFDVGWIAFEKKDYAGALPYYERGLRNDPDMASLETEYVLTLSMLGRNAEALQSLDAFMAAHPRLDAKHRGMVLRKRGYVLVELGRWAEADTAYRQSLEADPTSAVAKGELDYIAKSRPDRPH